MSCNSCQCYVYLSHGAVTVGLQCVIVEFADPEGGGGAGGPGPLK